MEKFRKLPFLKDPSPYFFSVLKTLNSLDSLNLNRILNSSFDLVQNEKKLQNIIELSHLPSCQKLHFKDIKCLESKLKKMKIDGPENMQIATDFDFTITSFNIDGRKNYAMLQLFNQSKHVSENFKKYYNQLRNKYIPLEHDLKIPIEEKRALMMEWHTKITALFAEEKINSNLIFEITGENKIGIRFNFNSFFSFCKEIHLPFYVVSAGVSEPISIILNDQVKFSEFEDVWLFANKFNLTEEGIITGYNPDIDTTSKQNVLKEKNILFKKNGLVIGDIIGDSHMCDSLGMESLIKVGFLYHPENLEAYKDHFDLVIEGDGDFVPTEAMIQYIANGFIDNRLKTMMKENINLEFLALFNE